MIINNTGCAIVEALLAVLLLHDADRARLSLSAHNNQLAYFIAVEIRQMFAAICITAASLRAIVTGAGRKWLEEAVMLLSFVVAMMDRVVEGCMGVKTQSECDPLGIVLMVITLIGAVSASAVRVFYSMKEPPVPPNAESLV